MSGQRAMDDVMAILRQWARERRYGDVTVTFKAGEPVIARTSETHKLNGRTENGRANVPPDS